MLIFHLILSISTYIAIYYVPFKIPDEFRNATVPIVFLLDMPHKKSHTFMVSQDFIDCQPLFTWGVAGVLYKIFTFRDKTKIVLFQNGTVIRLAEIFALPAPYNSVVHNIIKFIEAQSRQGPTL